MQEAREVAWNQTLMTRAGSRLPISRMEMKAPEQHRADTTPKRVPCAREIEEFQSGFQSEGFNGSAYRRVRSLHPPGVFNMGGPLSGL